MIIKFKCCEWKYRNIFVSNYYEILFDINSLKKFFCHYRFLLLLWELQLFHIWRHLPVENEQWIKWATVFLSSIISYCKWQSSDFLICWIFNYLPVSLKDSMPEQVLLFFWLWCTCYSGTPFPILNAGDHCKLLCIYLLFLFYLQETCLN